MTEGVDEVILLLGWAGGCSGRGLTERQQSQHGTVTAGASMPSQQVDYNEGRCPSVLVYPWCQGSREACCESAAGSRPTRQARFASVRPIS